MDSYEDLILLRQEIREISEDCDRCCTDCMFWDMCPEYILLNDERSEEGE